MNDTAAPGGDPRICGIIVTYNPDLVTLERLLNSVKPQVSNLIIVDNGSRVDLGGVADLHEIALLPLGENFGIARAQNIGFEFARECQAKYILLLDQDSIPAPNMVSRLVSAAQHLEHIGQPYAAVGPTYFDHRQGETAPFVYLKGLSLQRRSRPTSGDLVEADFLIASGSLIPLHSLDVAGDMVEELFIDYVDIEWGLRARQEGLKSYGVYDALMEHELGDCWIPYKGRQIPLHSPLRHYYHVRNAIWLARRPWISTAWVVVLLWRVVRQVAFFSIFAPQGREHAKLMSLGIWHGIRGRMGRK